MFKMYLAIVATDPPGTVEQYPIDSIEWSVDSSTGNWRIQFYAITRHTPEFLQVKIESANQAELSNFHSKILEAIGILPIGVAFELNGLIPDGLITLDLVTSKATLIAPSHILSPF